MDSAKNMRLEKLEPVIRKILKDRGIDSDEQIKEYLSPVPRLTYDPFLLKNMDPVCDRILKAADEGEKICIFGDYDADGVTSVALLTEYLGQLSTNVTYYIPSRFEEGYGLNDRASEKLAADGVSLIITVDCGCAARREVEYIKQLGMDIIVTDHHEVDPSRAPDCLMIDAKQQGESYPYHQLCGCGIALKIAQALRIRRNLPKEKLNHCLDLVGIATVADVVPLTGENRTLVKYGIDRIRKMERPGLKALLERAGIHVSTLTSYHIAFGIAPRIKSAGRMSTADKGVSLLSAGDLKSASESADDLERLNGERRSCQERIYEEALTWIDSRHPDDVFIVYHAGKANEGVTGVAAGKLREHYNRPVIIVSESSEKGFLKGTGRSIDGVDLFDLMNHHVDLFVKFGGHAAACGFTIAEDNLTELRRCLIQDMEEIVHRNPAVLEEHLVTDAVIKAEEVSFELARQISLMEPFGKDNEQPLFQVDDLHVLNVYSMGREKQYRKYQFRTSEGTAYAVALDTGIGGIYDVKEGQKISICAEISINTWNGRSSVQLIVRKIL